MIRSRRPARLRHGSCSAAAAAALQLQPVLLSGPSRLAPTRTYEACTGLVRGGGKPGQARQGRIRCRASPSPPLSPWELEFKRRRGRRRGTLFVLKARESGPISESARRLRLGEVASPRRPRVHPSRRGGRDPPSRAADKPLEAPGAAGPVGAGGRAGGTKRDQGPWREGRGRSS